MPRPQCTLSVAAYADVLLSCGDCDRAQAVAQLLQWLVLFLLMFGTYLFQVGLLGVLAKEFRAVTYAMPIYFVVWLLHTGHKLVRVWALPMYLASDAFMLVLTLSWCALACWHRGCSSTEQRGRRCGRTTCSSRCSCCRSSVRAVWTCLRWRVVSVPVPVSGPWLTRTPSRQLAVALFYYAIVIDATVKMGQPRLYQKAPWVAQYRAHS